VKSLHWVFADTHSEEGCAAAQLPFGAMISAWPGKSSVSPNGAAVNCQMGSALPTAPEFLPVLMMKD
jgi:hypothetical protein